MAGNIENLKPFKPGQSGNPKGRPKNRVPGVLAKVMPKTKAKKFFRYKRKFMRGCTKLFGIRW